MVKVKYFGIFEKSLPMVYTCEISRLYIQQLKVMANNLFSKVGQRSNLIPYIIICLKMSSHNVNTCEISRF